MILSYGGQKFEITNWGEFENTLLQAIGFQLEAEIVANINRFGLVDTGAFKQSIHSEVTSEGLIITSSVPYAVFLEYGTLEYWRKYGLKSFPEVPVKKKDLPRSEWDNYLKGIAPFAPFRRVLYNPDKMKVVIDKAVKLAQNR